MGLQDDSRQGRGATLPVSIKPEYIGLAAGRAAVVLTAAEAGQHYFAYDTGDWSVWDGAAWRSFTSPAVPIAVTIGALAFSDGADTAEGATTDAAVTSPAAAGSVIALLKGLLTTPRIVAGQSRTSITCTLAATDYAAAAVIPAATTRILVQSAGADAVLANEATTATAGLALRADQQYVFRVAAGDTLHARSATPGTVVSISYLKN